VGKLTSYVLDGAPITVRGNENWSAKVFNRHLPVLYFHQLLESLHSAVVAPVIDVIVPGRYSELESGILADFLRRTGIRDLRIIDEAIRKTPVDFSVYQDFLNSLDIDLAALNSNGNLLLSSAGVTGYRGRLSCTLAELLVYHDKMQMVPSASDVVLMTGYDQSYLSLYGSGTKFRESVAEISSGLSARFNCNVEVVSFIYATNPRLNLREFTKEFSQFSSSEQEEIVLSNTLYTLATAYLFKQGDVNGDLRAFREKCRDFPRLGEVRDLVAGSELRNQEDFDGMAERMYGLM